MKKRKRKNTPGAGRPPAGVAGEKASTYPNVRIEPTVLAGLKALAVERVAGLRAIPPERFIGWRGAAQRVAMEAA